MRMRRRRRVRRRSKGWVSVGEMVRGWGFDDGGGVERRVDEVLM
jgi:hypothetical protein